MLQIALIDDEADARATLRILLQRYLPSANVIGEADCVAAGIDLLRAQTPDVLFLDIAMPDGTGFDLLDLFPQPAFRVVFTTAFDQFAIKAFKYHAVDYLLKPVDPQELRQTLLHLENLPPPQLNQQLNHLLTTIRQRQFDKLTLPSKEGLTFVELDEICFLEADGNYTSVCLQDGKSHLVTRPIKDYESLLPEEAFCRTHQSYIVNLKYVDVYLREDGGYLILRNKKQIPVSRRRKDVLLSRLRREG